MDVVSLSVVFISQTSFYILIPPFLCGALTVFLFSSCTFLPFADGASIGLITGVVGGIILIILGTPVAYLIPGGIDQMHMMNWNPFAAGFLQTLSAMGVLGIANLVLATAGGVLAAVLLKRG